MKIYKNISILAGLIIILVFYTIFLIKQPFVFDYKFSNQLLGLDLSKEEKLFQIVKYLSESERTTIKGQERTINYILEQLKINNILENQIEIQEYKVNEEIYKNIIVHLKQDNKSDNPKYIIGGHYDAFGGKPGADDNGSAIAGLLEISRILNQNNLKGKDIDIVFYSTEEPPFFGTEKMGSYIHANSIKEDKNIKLVLILEMIGYFSEEKNSQDFPIGALNYIYPNVGNFIAVVGNFNNIGTTRNIKKRFKSYLKINNFIGAESINAPNFIPGIDFSDHRNYWKFQIPAIMITDTAFYRNKNYHLENDTFEKLDYKKMKEVVDASILTILSL